MSRTAFRNFWLLVVGILLVTSFFVFRKGQEIQTDIERSVKQMERLSRDLRSSNQLSVALNTLNKLTIDENRATRLDILRHLGLEKSDLRFLVSNKSIRKIGPTSLYARNFTLSGELPYARALEQIDWLYSTEKVAMNDIVLEAGDNYGDSVKFRIGGVLYGLDKTPQSEARRSRRARRE